MEFNMIRLINKDDIHQLAIIYKDLYDNVDIGENWTIESATNLLTYWYSKQKDLFFVYIENGEPVGAIVSGVKNWFDGIRLVDTELFVAKSYQNKGIAKELFLRHLLEAKLKYNAKMMEFHTYGDEDEFPQKWYKKIGFKKDDDLIIMSGDVEKVIEKLNPNINSVKSFLQQNKDLKEQYIKPFTYEELSKLYSNLKNGDTAYIFDMLPEYSYLDNDSEIEYLKSRKVASENGANVKLFIVGSLNKVKSMLKNKLFKNTLLENPNIFILNDEDLKDKIPYHFFQLGNGLYYAERKNGDIESFRDLWSSNQIGIYYKNVETNVAVKNTINIILTKIKNGELVNHYHDIISLS